MVKINGESTAFDGMTVSEALARLGYDIKRVAVERGGEIVPRAAYGETVLRDGDSIEVVCFFGGG